MRPDILKKIPTVFHLPDIVKWHQEKQTIYRALEWYLEAPEFGILDQDVNNLGLMLLFYWQKRTCWFSRRKKKNKTIKQDHYALWTKHHYRAPFWWVEYNELGTRSFNFLPDTQAVDLRGKCPIRHVLSCNALEDIENHWTQMDSGSTPPEWTLLLSSGVGFLHLTPFPL